MDAPYARGVAAFLPYTRCQQASLCTLTACDERGAERQRSKVVLVLVKSTGKQLLKHVVPAVVKPMRVLWNEVIGFVFLALGVMMAFSTYRNFRDVD